MQATKEKEKEKSIRRGDAENWKVSSAMYALIEMTLTDILTALGTNIQTPMPR
jgi:hypothetical protein